MTLSIVNTTILFLLIAFGKYATTQQPKLHKRVLIQELLKDGFYLESGPLLGQGNMFFSTKGAETLINLDKIDTVFIFDLFSTIECLTFQRDQNCLIKKVISSKKLKRSKKLIRRINKGTLHPDKVKKLYHRVVKCEYQICKIETKKVDFLNYRLKKGKYPLFVAKEVVVVNIICSD